MAPNDAPVRLDSVSKIVDMALMTKPEKKNEAPRQDGGQPLSRYERQRERILDAATSILNQRGISGMTLQEVADLRKICPPGETAPEADVDLAVRLLRDRALYAHAVQSATSEAAVRP